MTELIVARYVHFISIMFVFAMVWAEYFLVNRKILRADLIKLFTIDGIYGLFSLVAVGAGLYLWFGTGKPASFYNTNGLFHLKVGLFVVVGILSLCPTTFYFKNRKGDKSDEITLPAYIKKIIVVELILLCIIPVLATIMSRGIDIF